MDHCHNKNYIFYAIIFTALFGVIEALSGWWSGSLTLLSDAGHMGIDTLALTLAAFAAWISGKPATAKHTYGLGRAEVIIAWISSIFLIIMITKIFIEAIHRLHSPHIVASKAVIIVAIIGLFINLVTALILTKSKKTLNIQAALLHVLSDLLGSIAVLVSGILIYFTHWTIIDPIFSIFVCVLIFIATIRLLRESLLILMEGAPIHLKTTAIENTMRHVNGVCEIHDLHIWTLTSGIVLLSAHVILKKGKSWPKIVNTLRKVIEKEFGITHVTLQPETLNQKHLCTNCKHLNS
jgi:cobalt-zinc-cadmium efflux system protein